MKFPTQHVTAGYLARPYPKGDPKKTSLEGPFRHLKFDKNDLMVEAAEMKDLWSPESCPWYCPTARGKYKSKSEFHSVSEAKWQINFSLHRLAQVRIILVIFRRQFRRRVYFCQTLSVWRDPQDLFFWALLLDMVLLGTQQLRAGLEFFLLQSVTCETP